MFNVGANEKIQRFVFNLFGSYKPGKEQEGIQKYLDLFLLLHSPKISDAYNHVQLLSEGIFNLSQQYKFVWASFTMKILTRNQNSNSLNVPAYPLARIMSFLWWIHWRWYHHWECQVHGMSIMSKQAILTLPLLFDFPQLSESKGWAPEDISSWTYLTSVIDDIFGTESIVEAIEASLG